MKVRHHHRDFFSWCFLIDHFMARTGMKMLQHRANTKFITASVGRETSNCRLSSGHCGSKLIHLHATRSSDIHKNLVPRLQCAQKLSQCI